MSNIDKHALRKLAVDAKELAIIKRYTKGIEAQKKFIAEMTPATVLALLDELEAAEKLNAELMEKQRLIDICQGQGLEHRIAAGKRAESAGWQVKKHGGNWVSIKQEDVDHYRFNEELPVREVYTAPPAPVAVPDDVSGPLAHAYKELTPTFMRNHIDVFERYGIYPDGSAGIQAMRIALDGINRRAAMLQGAEHAESPTTMQTAPALDSSQIIA